MKVPRLMLLVVLSMLPGHALDERIDWPSFLSGHDPVWNRMGKDWWEAPFVGNGELGMMARLAGERVLSFQIGSNRVHDHRTDDLWQGKVPDAIEVQNRGRLPVGRFELMTVGRIDPAKSSARIDLWNAEARGTLVTDRGGIAWRIFIHATKGTGLIELKKIGGESEATLSFKAEPAVSPRESRLPGDFRRQRTPNPPVKYEGNGSKGHAAQQLAAGGGYVTAWDEAGGRLFWSLAYDREELPAHAASGRV
jgi:alpha-L-fucosidase 2